MLLVLSLPQNQPADLAKSALAFAIALLDKVWRAAAYLTIMLHELLI
jgi:hypothetical protein